MQSVSLVDAGGPEDLTFMKSARRTQRERNFGSGDYGSCTELNGDVMRHPGFSSTSDNVGPLLVTASNARFLMDFPDGSERLCAADLEVRRGNAFLQRFDGILFVEGGSLALIYGVECEDGYPNGLARALALAQQEFIQFLRHQNYENMKLLGPLARVFSSHAYSSELLVTRAYLNARDSKLDAGVGYLDEATSKYVLLRVGAD